MAIDYDLGTARGKIEIDSSQLGRTSVALGTVGKGMIALGGLAAAGFVVAVKSAADFEKAISAVAAVSQASQSEVQALRDLALDLGSTTVFSAGEIVKAMEALAKAGIPVEDMLNGATQATVNLAAAAGDELPGGVERAAEIISNAQKTFSASASELEHFADVLVGAAASSTLNVEDLATAFRYAAPIAAQLGLSIDDLNTVLAILGDRGIKGSTAGTSLRGVLLSLTPSSAKAKAAMKDLGLITADGTNKFYDLNGSLKPIPEVMQLLGDATKNLSDQEKVAAFNSIFQRRAMNSALILAELGAEGFDKYSKAIGGISAADVAATKLDNLSGDVTKLENSFNALMIRAGQPFQDMIRGWVQSITGLVNKLGKLDPETIKIGVQVLAAAGAFLIAAGSVLLLASYMIRAYRTFLILKEGIALVTAAMKLMAISFLTNPVFLIIAAIVILVALLYLAYRRSETFREAFDTAFDNIQPTIERIVGWIQNFVSLLDNLWRAFQEGGIEGDAFSNVLDRMGLNSEQVVGALIWMRDAFIWLKNAAITAFDYFADVILPLLIEFGYTLVNAVQSAVSWIVGTAIPAIVRFGQTVADIAVSVASWFNEHIVPALAAFAGFVVAVAKVIGIAIAAIWPVFTFLGDVIFAALRFIMSLIGPFVKAVITIWKYLGDNLIELIVIAWNFIVGVFEGFFQVIQGLFQFFSGLLTLNWSQMWEGIKNIVGGVLKLLSTIIGTGIDLIRLIFETALDLIVLAWKLAWNLIPVIWNAAWALFFELLNAGVQLVIGLWKFLASIVNTVWDALWELVVNILKAAWRGIVETIARNVASVIAWFINLRTRTIGIFQNAVSWLVTAGYNILAGLLNGLNRGFVLVINWLIALPGNVVRWLGDVSSWLYQAGKDLIQGFINGIKDMASTVKDVAGDVASGAAGAVKGILGIGSPSKVFEQYGKWTVEGFVQGLKNMKAIESQMGKMAALTSSPLALGAPAGSVSNRESTQVNITIHGVKDAAGVRATLTDAAVLDQIMSAVKAGRR